MFLLNFILPCENTSVSCRKGLKPNILASPSLSERVVNDKSCCNFLTDHKVNCQVPRSSTVLAGSDSPVIHIALTVRFSGVVPLKRKLSPLGMN